MQIRLIFKSITIFILTLLLVVSVGFNLYYLQRGALHVTHEHYNENHVTNHNQQYQGQMQMNMWMSRGDVLEWHVEGFQNEEQLAQALELLPPHYSYFVKVVYVGDAVDNLAPWRMFVPIFMKKK